MSRIYIILQKIYWIGILIHNLHKNKLKKIKRITYLISIKSRLIQSYVMQYNEIKEIYSFCFSREKYNLIQLK